MHPEVLPPRGNWQFDSGNESKFESVRDGSVASGRSSTSFLTMHTQGQDLDHGKGQQQQQGQGHGQQGGRLPPTLSEGVDPALEELPPHVSAVQVTSPSPAFDQNGLSLNTHTQTIDNQRVVGDTSEGHIPEGWTLAGVPRRNIVAPANAALEDTVGTPPPPTGMAPFSGRSEHSGMSWASGSSGEGEPTPLPPHE